MKIQKEIPLQSPITDDEDIKKLNIGDKVLLSGIIITGRDAFHKKLISMDSNPSFLPVGSAIYHCGPIAKFAANHSIQLLAAGPTTSWRMGLYAPKIIEKFKIKIFIGKGGMGDNFTEACKKYTAIYLSFPGGCAQSACQYISKVKGCYFLEEFGPAEAAYEIYVKNFPLIVTIDSYGRSLHRQVKENSTKLNQKIIHD
ncbi:MAG TPA: FumA C-terminus/TtdB family hydratase beta subunit [Victivallales bacterium]|nr:FumA C-terminus/TtdB family hydratase beta subunit [Victivallales bacterium]HPO89929.1 FumA C-terminus/TtdB family hydratase beta subunit [Victivallales bacterium]HRR05750.1 FumA C-terminus/TtdB family hydratase beta subunit [Victivallales bacterium]HRU01498.1 FumA C-terminus/TtdB family hydratase beta subunit [Victivallales bacterium]